MINHDILSRKLSIIGFSDYTVEWFKCGILEETMFGESMAHKVISKVNVRLKFLHQKSKYLAPNLHRLLCNALIQHHFDSACSAGYPSLSKKQNSKITKYVYSFLYTVGQNVKYITKRIQRNLKQLIGCLLKKNIISK